MNDSLMFEPIIFAPDTAANGSQGMLEDALFSGIFKALPSLSCSIVQAAIEYAAKYVQPAHAAAQMRDIADCLILLQGLDVDAETLAAAALTQAPLTAAGQENNRLTTHCGADVTALVQGIVRAGKAVTQAGLNEAAKSAQDVEVLRKMLLAMADDVRVVLVKLAQQVVLLHRLSKAPEVSQMAAARQTRNLFAPLANRLGVFQIKWELEDYSFRYLDAAKYKTIAALLDGKRTERERYIAGVVAQLVGVTKQAGITADVMGRPKHIYSIHKKMQSKNLSYDQLYDIRAVRLLVDTVPECYTVLSVVHDLFTPVLGEFDDYIAQPKANNYQSLHTAVVGSENKTLEVQIRTRAMHQASEHGVAAHWRYKEGKKDTSKADKSFEEKIAWLRQVLEWKQEIVDEGEFSDAVKQGLFADTIYVLTPQGRVVDLPAGSTAVDFAYHLHTDLGHRCRGAKIDGQLVALNTPLKNAQRVEILSAKQGGPSRDWINPQLGYLKSHRALSKVRAWFRQEYFEVDVAHGRQTLDKELARHAASNIAQDKLAHALEHKSVDELLAAIGRNEITAHQIDIALRGMLSPVEVVPGDALEMPVFRVSSGINQTGKASSGVLVLGVNNIATMVARCCKPLPPDEITGFVTRTRGVTVHRLDCENITCLNAEQRERLMPAAWGTKLEEVAFASDVEVIARDRQGLLRDISEILSREKINVTGVNTLSKNSMASMRFTLEVRRNDDIARVIRAVSGVMGVESVKRR